MDYPLGPVTELPPREGKQYNLDINGIPLELFVIRHEDNYLAYENRCPHRGVSLNWQPDRFLSEDETHIQCTTHGAQFEIGTGLCVWGPCQGESLRSLPVRIEQDMLILSLDQAWVQTRSE